MKIRSYFFSLLLSAVPITSNMLSASANDKLTKEVINIYSNKHTSHACSTRNMAAFIGCRDLVPFSDDNILKNYDPIFCASILEARVFQKCCTEEKLKIHIKNNECKKNGF